MGLFLSPGSDQRQREQSEKQHQEESDRIGALGWRKKKNDEELVKGQEINFFLLTDL
jgi:hypothetical protein